MYYSTKNHCVPFNYLIFVCLHLALCSRISLQSHEKTTVKEDLRFSSNQTINQSNEIKSSLLLIQHKNKSEAKIKDDHSKHNTLFQKDPDDEIPESFKMEFFFFIGLSIAAILFILSKIHRMKLSRAERKYGVHGDRSTQELTPLPMAVEDYSDNEDHTVFDIKKLIAV